MSEPLVSDYSTEMFEQVRDKNETIYWVGKPNPFCFMIGGIPFLIIGMVWGCIDFALFMSTLHNQDGSQFFIIPFLMLHSFPCWGSWLYMVWLWLAHNRTFYAYSNRRLMLQTGAIGTDIKTFDYSKVTNLEVTVGPIEKMFSVGSIRFNTGVMTNRGQAVVTYFKAIQDPYDVFKKIKGISVDIRTDENYPNALRPDTNPGYKTKYKPDDRS